MHGFNLRENYYTTRVWIFCVLWVSDFGFHISMASTLPTEMVLQPENTFLKYFIFVFSCECLCVHEYSAPGTQQGTGSFGPGILSDCGQTSMGAGNITQLPCKSGTGVQPQSYLSSSKNIHIKCYLCE